MYLIFISKKILCTLLFSTISIRERKKRLFKPIEKMQSKQTKEKKTQEKSSKKERKFFS